ncbi:glycosyltransferase [Bosea caraganae]|uniref:Glycosyltransferase n=1 Tax=Bosea caraganae TaxID=2763117 RepID=A0A370L550_9HYPH|nr:glycosyltransferase family 4 protein [Bosea caraganae]RDJ24080.1 glycosyltransferase [Bosea caraganae]RDJ30122.1 glycosyltransferase [Bosea caraganae]
MGANLLSRPRPVLRVVASAGARRRLDIRHVIIDDVSPHPSAANGIHHVAGRIAREQVAAGDDARIIFLRQQDMAGEAESFDLPTLILPLDGPRIMGHPVAMVPEAVAALTAGAGPDTIFHIHTARQPLLLSLVRELARRNLAFGITVHGRYSHVIDARGRVANWKSALYLRLIERRAIERARFVQAVSQAEADVIRRLAPRARICVIPNAAFSSALDGAPPAPRRVASFAAFPTFGFCGRYEIVHKGLDLLVEGFALYRREGGPGRLVLIGTGPARDVIAAMVNTSGIADAVDIHGPCFGAEKQRRMQDWDFFVQPSRFDGVPIAALEAALTGLPLIVSTETGLAQALQAAGAGIVIRNLTAAAVALSFAEAALVSPKAWSAMAASAHDMAIAIGDWTPIAASLRKLYL